MSLNESGITSVNTYATMLKKCTGEVIGRKMYIHITTHLYASLLYFSLVHRVHIRQTMVRYFHFHTVCHLQDSQKTIDLKAKF